VSQNEPIDLSFRPEPYLLDQGDDATGIASIDIDSTLGDVTTVYAYLDGSLIRYRVEDEYGGSTLTGGTTECESVEPLTLSELNAFFLDAWPLLEVLEKNFESDDTQGMLGFFRGRSQFYPDFDRLLRQQVIETYPESGQRSNRVQASSSNSAATWSVVPGGELDRPWTAPNEPGGVRAGFRRSRWPTDRGANLPRQSVEVWG
jgi:hypothetical protein